MLSGWVPHYCSVIIKMFDKAQNYARRGFVTLKHHAKEAYKHGRNFMSKMWFCSNTKKYKADVYKL